MAASPVDLPSGAQDYIERFAGPYFEALAAWYGLLRIGFTYNLGNYRLKNRSTNLRNSELQRIQDE